MHALPQRQNNLFQSPIFIFFMNSKSKFCLWAMKALMIMSHNFPPRMHEKLCHSYCLLRRRGWSSAAGALAWAWLWPERMASRWTPCLLVSGPWVYLRTESGRRRKRKKSVLHPHHLTHSCDPSALAILTEKVSGLFLADLKIRDCLFKKISNALRGGKRSARKRLLRPRMPRCSEPCTSHTRTHTGFVHM